MQVVYENVIRKTTEYQELKEASNIRCRLFVHKVFLKP